MFFGKKGDAGVGVIFIIVVIVLFLMWVVTYSQRECNSNEDCSKDSYCGSDFSCHQYPNIVQQKVAAADYTVPAFLLGLSIVVAAIILRKRDSGNSPAVAPSAPHFSHRPTHDEGDRSMASSQYFEHYGEDATPLGGEKHH
ncbi:TPA: hypothetical protein HA281_01490 [Candidatus Woesearchaeota archaeon]|nr:hypothetical protein [Candidatus Woesearchaeota archaeon]HIH91452.1 hypothetical protein [Candidatus Woesearchaeota archaeon]HII64478.1 hypothetical protein [Candidatus Woesearchaeota archaeon]HIJ18063.1 hypothetical protein [Candidatus Woesearchaeota archaeon]